MRENRYLLEKNNKLTKANDTLQESLLTCIKKMMERTNPMPKEILESTDDTPFSFEQPVSKNKFFLLSCYSTKI